MITAEKDGKVYWVFKNSEIIGSFQMGRERWMFFPAIYKMSAEDLREIADYLETL